MLGIEEKNLETDVQTEGDEGQMEEDEASDDG